MKNNNYILAIDPGNILSAYVVLDGELRPVQFGKVDNEWLNDNLADIINKYRIKNVAIEMVASMGMAVGQTIFDTCVWIGRFTQTAYRHIDIDEVTYIYRKDEKINICGNMKAKDANISQALRDRFGDKGTIKNKGWFFGFKADIWQAYAVAITYYDMYLSKKAM